MGPRNVICANGAAALDERVVKVGRIVDAVDLAPIVDSRAVMDFQKNDAIRDTCPSLSK
jgi:hypothetical protein